MKAADDANSADHYSSSLSRGQRAPLLSSCLLLRAVPPRLLHAYSDARWAPPRFLTRKTKNLAMAPASPADAGRALLAAALLLGGVRGSVVITVRFV